MIVTTRAIGTFLYLLVTYVFSTEANYVVEDKWGQQYCRPSFCGIMGQEGWIKCCERYKKCCSYVEMMGGAISDPFSFDKPKPIHETTTPRPTTPTPTTAKPVETTEDLGGPIELLPSAIAAGISGSDQSGLPLRLSSRDQVKPVTLEEDHRPRKPIKPSKNDVTFLLPALHPDIQEIRLEQHRREACRAKFCGLMEINQWQNCCYRYKNCCAYVDHHAYQVNPFYFEA